MGWKHPWSRDLPREDPPWSELGFSFLKIHVAFFNTIKYTIPKKNFAWREISITKWYFGKDSPKEEPHQVWCQIMLKIYLKFVINLWRSLCVTIHMKKLGRDAFKVHSYKSWPGKLKIYPTNYANELMKEGNYHYNVTKLGRPTQGTSPHQTWPVVFGSQKNILNELC